MYICEIRNLTKKFGNATILDDITLSFEKGKIHGLIGRNGSGKTMMLKCVCGFVPATEGEIWVSGKQIGKDIDIPDNVGIIIEAPGFLPNYSGYMNLRLLAKIRQTIGKEDIRQAIQQVGLDPSSKKHVGKYSLGMRQRLGIAQALMENPEFLILDEPMNGLDNAGAEDIRKLLLVLKEQGKTILLASHGKEDIQVLCDTVCELDHGRCVSFTGR
ncbi:MAG: ATP-binding cassette domain-containing protein [Prevotella sp.]|jgi:ABC-2 type transport system ATP-binding protein|nr:ATP-binding cassette domain-containing protein [Prevotella sp.]